MSPENIASKREPHNILVNGQPVPAEQIGASEVIRLEKLACEVLEPLPSRVELTCAYGIEEEDAAILFATSSINNRKDDATVKVDLLTLEEEELKFSLQYESTSKQVKFYCPTREELSDACFISSNLINNSRIDEQVRRVLSILEPLILDFRLSDEAKTKVPPYADSQSQRIAKIVWDIVSQEAASEVHLKNYENCLSSGDKLRLLDARKIWRGDNTPVSTAPDLQIAYEDLGMRQAYYYRRHDAERSLNLRTTEREANMTDLKLDQVKSLGRHALRLMLGGLKEISFST